MITYIAGPMSGIPNYNRLAFYQAARELKQGGDTVLNPATLPDGLFEADYMRIVLAMLQCAQGIFMLEDWQDSEGALAEFHLARKLRLYIRFQGYENVLLA
ncbi:hypothetical protein SGGMMB4_03424 [Sodalis glossinidius str. 'morsitans']|uniref:Hypothetical phage protein n=1 Tax=Sodalis glossinidius (strain morsitans) TaxID=343509 RepID=Q2NSU1_SODGM|nr:DUF4406 domain-containing protein [Sodalis glossinidius]BAE74784.1 hypothetical phage protein [Sodalis glossinidius str. 'morsitans']CRL45589.1 hypothetical protein SGGMMB4_03424 [Sodalis glossinidius str. 'morsitans']